jgi:hypothetical protein
MELGRKLKVHRHVRMPKPEGTPSKDTPKEPSPQREQETVKSS